VRHRAGDALAGPACLLGDRRRAWRRHGAELARQRLATFPNVEVETSSFEEWDDRGRHFDVVVAAAAWHWVDPAGSARTTCSALQDGWHCSATSSSAGWARPRSTPDRRPPRARLPGQPRLGPPTARGRGARDRRRAGVGRRSRPLVRPDDRAVVPVGAVVRRGGLRRSPPLDLLYRRLAPGLCEPLLDAIADRVHTRMGDRVSRRYLRSSRRPARRLTRGS